MRPLREAASSFRRPSQVNPRNVILRHGGDDDDDGGKRMMCPEGSLAVA